MVSRGFKQLLVGYQIDGVKVIDVDGTQATHFGAAQQLRFALAQHASREADVPTASSRARLARLDARLSEGAWGVAELQALFADRSDGVDSICRYAEDNQGTATDSCVIALPARGELWACRGPADRGRWIRLGFD